MAQRDRWASQGLDHTLQEIAFVHSVFPRRLQSVRSFRYTVGMNKEHDDDMSDADDMDQSEAGASLGSGAERLQKVLAAAGFGSRRSCEDLISTGRVTIDRTTATELGVRVNPNTQKIYVDGDLIRLERKRYFLLCKPKGVVCTAFDPANRTKAIDLLPKDYGRLFTVGRLDENSEGLLLVTNDGELAHRLAHPRFQVERRYRVLVAGQPTEQVLAELKQGMFFTEGKFRVHDVRRISAKGQSSVLEVTLTEGHNREIRRLLARVGHKVMALMRVAFGPLVLSDLPPGAFRELSPTEVKALKAFADGKRSAGQVSARGKSGANRKPSSGRSSSTAKPTSRPAAKTSSTVGRATSSKGPLARRVAAKTPAAPKDSTKRFVAKGTKARPAKTVSHRRPPSASRGKRNG